jgi:hypothetical protein
MLASSLSTIARYAPSALPRTAPVASGDRFIDRKAVRFGERTRTSRRVTFSMTAINALAHVVGPK